MKIIEIRRTQNGGEVAYVLDQGRIFKLPIEDLTGAESQSESYEEEEVVQPRRRSAQRRAPERTELTIDDIPDDLPMAPARAEIPIPEIGKPAPKKPTGPRPKGIPANMIDIFKKPPELS